MRRPTRATLLLLLPLLAAALALPGAIHAPLHAQEEATATPEPEPAAGDTPAPEEQQPVPPAPTSTEIPPAPPAWPTGVPLTTGACHARGALPDPACTPGATFPAVTAADVCRPGYATSVRAVTAAQRRIASDWLALGHELGALP